MESKLTKGALRIISENPVKFGDMLDRCVIAIASNAGWAPLLPGAVVSKAFDTAIEVYNAAAELEEIINHSL